MFIVQLKGQISFKMFYKDKFYAQKDQFGSLLQRKILQRNT